MIVHVEIPVTDLSRAMAFYGALLGTRFAEPIALHDSLMAYAEVLGEGASWALCQGDVYVPTRNGAILYVFIDDLDAVLAKAATLGSELIFPKTTLDDGSHVAEISDSEGNRLALQGN